MAVDIVKLNRAQKEAVTWDEGPILLVAGAGTGKTTVITNRVAWLIAQGKAKADEILAVTFTEKAAAEMEERVDRLLPLGYADLWIHTFHALCHRILAEHAIDIGLPNELKVLDTTGSWMLVREHLSAFDLDYYKPLGNPTRFIHALVTHFSRCKDEGVYPEEYLNYAESLKLNSDQVRDREAIESEGRRLEEVANAYHTYQKLMLENAVLDFGDLINYTVKLFQKRPKILEQYHSRFKYILVDEFQDTNWMQYELIKILAVPKNNIMVVGDDDQSIYKFRGASFSNIMTFKKDFPRAKKIYLVDNYRTRQTILDVAYRFIQLNNPDRLEFKLKSAKSALSKKLISHTGSEGQIMVSCYETADDEVRGVIERILKLKQSHKDFSWNDVAILVRANEQAQRVVRYMRSLNLPHQFLAAKGLYSQDVIIHVLSYLKLLDNYHESEALYDILSLPIWNIKHEDLVSLTHLASQKSWSLWHAIQNYRGSVELMPTSSSALERALHLIVEHAQRAKTLDPSVVIYRFLEDSGYLEFLTREDTQYTRTQMLYLNQFYKKIRTWEEENLGKGVRAFVEYINLELEAGDAGSLLYDVEEGPEDIKISTIHSAKGLEYRFVFVIGLVHLRFPSRERKDPIELPDALVKDILPEGDAHLQEERRLMYVALTRAKEKVCLSYAKNYGGASVRKPSQFIEELGFDSTIHLEEVNREFVPVGPRELQPKKLSYTLPARFSFTQVRVFETCPKQYYYAHIIKIPAAGRATFSFGKIMHAVLQKFFELVRERSKHKQEDLFDKKKTSKKSAKKPVSEKELLELYESLWQEDWFFDEENKKKYKELGRSILKEFYASLGSPIPVPVALEQPFTMKLDGMSFRGVIDRVDEIEQKGKKQWKLIDYKTGKAPKENKLTFDDKEQLLLYQIASREVFGKEIGSLVLYFLNSNTPIEFIGTEAELTRVREKALKTLAAIKQSDFSATPGFWCGSCDFKHICPAAQK